MGDPRHEKCMQKELLTSLQSFTFLTSDNILPLSGHDLAIKVLHESRTFACSSTHKAGASLADIERPSLASAWMDTFITATVFCVPADGSERVSENLYKF